MENIFFNVEKKLLDLVKEIQSKYETHPEKKESLAFLLNSCNEYSESILLMKATNNVYKNIDKEQATDLIIVIESFLNNSNKLLKLLK